MLSFDFSQVPVESIQVSRETRQRRVIKTDGLRESIAARGVMNPIIVDRELNLIAGERRLAASRELKLPTIPVRFSDELSTLELQIIELEENVAREDLTWQDRCQATVRIHNLYLQLDPEWTQQRTADALGMTKGTISLYLGVGSEVLKGNEKIAKATTVRQAHNTINRDTERRNADLLGELTDGIARPGNLRNGVEDASGRDDSPVLCGDFSIWARDYTGPKFNFLHCDFPYGVNMQDSDQGNSELYGAYEDTPEVYWSLLGTLARYQDNFLKDSAHMMFWFSMTFYSETLEFFRQHMPDWEVNTFPLIWVKSDNKGILPDPKRGPRRIYETCLHAARGDRLIVKAVSNAYSAPTGVKAHQSEKPEPVLRHFMQMFVDEHSLMFDPTCGAGSSLRAAESLGATRVFGIEKNEEFADGAALALKKFRSLRAAASK